MTPSGLSETVRRTIRRHAMLAGGETVLVAVSGGADSVALVHLLRALAPELGLTLHILHVDHRLRADSAADAEFVRRLGGRLGIPVDVVAVEVAAGGSREEAARKARYAALEACAARIGAARIALGHTADDQAETVLMRILTGAGVRGLAGIPAVRGRVIRPLLNLHRADLVTELRRAGVSWREDPSNQDPKFLRNRVRHELLPLLAASHDPGIVARLNTMAARARETVDALDGLASRELDRLARPGPDAMTVSRAALRELPPAVAVEVLRQAAARLGHRAPLRAWAHRRLQRVLAAVPPRRPVRLGTVVIEVSGDRVRLGTGSLPSLIARTLVVPGTVELPEVGETLVARLVDVRAEGRPAEPRGEASGEMIENLRAAEYVAPAGHARVAFDADRIGAVLTIRARRRGDRFTPWGGGERRLKTFLIDAKVPRWERRRLPIVEAHGAILWVGGLRRSALAPSRRARNACSRSLSPPWRTDTRPG